MELADTSVWAQRYHASVRGWFEDATLKGELAICEMIALELLHAPASASSYTLLRELLQGIPWVHMGSAEWTRALEVQGLLAEKGRAQHRSVKHPDLLIAAAAELAEIGLVHYDQDFDAISAVTGQPARWVAPQGSL